MKKRAIQITAFVAIAYLVMPLISGMLDYSDPRGPIIYPESYHSVGHRIGGALFGRPGAKVPLRERPVFYGLAGKRIEIDPAKIQEAVDQYEREHSKSGGSAIIN